MLWVWELDIVGYRARDWSGQGFGSHMGTLKMRDMKMRERKFCFRLSCLPSGHHFRVELVLKRLNCWKNEINTGCEYGDRATWCKSYSQEECQQQQNVRETCCFTCNGKTKIVDTSTCRFSRVSSSLFNCIVSLWDNCRCDVRYIGCTSALACVVSAPLKSRYVTWGAIQVLYALCLCLTPKTNALQ